MTDHRQQQQQDASLSSSATSSCRIFLSYSSCNRNFVLRLKQDLEQHPSGKYKVWMDNQQIKGGDEWLSEIEDNLRQSHAVLICVSQQSNQSKWVKREAIMAENLNIKRIPLLLDDSSLPLYLLDLQYIDFRHYSSTPNPRRRRQGQSPALQQLLDSLQDVKAPKRRPDTTPLPDPPLVEGRQLSFGSLPSQPQRDVSSIQSIRSLRESVGGFFSGLWERFGSTRTTSTAKVEERKEENVPTGERNNNEDLRQEKEDNDATQEKATLSSTITKRPLPLASTTSSSSFLIAPSSTKRARSVEFEEESWSSKRSKKHKKQTPSLYKCSGCNMLHPKGNFVKSSGRIITVIRIIQTTSIRSNR